MILVIAQTVLSTHPHKEVKQRLAHSMILPHLLSAFYVEIMEVHGYTQGNFIDSKYIYRSEDL